MLLALVAAIMQPVMTLVGSAAAIGLDVRTDADQGQESDIMTPELFPPKALEYTITIFGHNTQNPFGTITPHKEDPWCAVAAGLDLMNSNQ